MTKKPSANQLAERNLDDARILLLEAQDQAEYHAGIATILQQRIRRLENRRKDLVAEVDNQS